MSNALLMKATIAAQSLEQLVRGSAWREELAVLMGFVTARCGGVLE